MKKFFVVFVIIAMLSNTTLSYAQENYGLEIMETYMLQTEPVLIENYPNIALYNLGEMKLTSLLDSETIDLPGKYNYDVNNLKYVSPVKDQLSSGNCWIFSALGAAESYMLKRNNIAINDTYDFSENHMQYMVSKEYNNTKFGHNMALGSGGNFGKAIPYFLNRIGLVNEKDDEFVWPAKGRDYSETANIPISDYIVTGTIFNHEEIKEYDGRDYDKKAERRETLKKVILSYGSAVCSLNASSAYFAEEEKKNLYYFPVSETAKTVDTNHSVLIVGWDDTYDKENFRHTVGGIEIVPPDDGAFIVKNSWGTDACDDGFFYLSYYDYFAGYELFAITKMERRNTDEILYSYDEFFPYSGIGFNLQDSAGNVFPASALMYGNQFERKTDNEILTDVSFYATKGSEYNIYIINDELEEAYNDKGEKVVRFSEMSTKTTQIYKGFIPEYDGYYTLDVTDTKITSEKFSVMLVCGNINGDYQYLPIESNAPGAEVTNATQQKLQSFFYFYFEDYPAFMYDYFDKFDIHGNAPVKAITKTQEKYTDISFVNFTNEAKAEEKNYHEGDTVRISAVVDGVNLEETTLICGIYNGNKLVKVLDKPMGNKGNVFEYQEIPADFDNCIAKVFAIDSYNSLKPLGNAFLIEEAEINIEAHNLLNGICTVCGYEESITGDIPTGDIPTGDIPTGGDIPSGDIPTDELIVPYQE